MIVNRNLLSGMAFMSSESVNAETPAAVSDDAAFQQAARSTGMPIKVSSKIDWNK